LGKKDQSEVFPGKKKGREFHKEKNTSNKGWNADNSEKKRGPQDQECPERGKRDHLKLEKGASQSPSSSKKGEIIATAKKKGTGPTTENERKREGGFCLSEGVFLLGSPRKLPPGGGGEYLLQKMKPERERRRRIARAKKGHLGGKGRKLDPLEDRGEKDGDPLEGKRGCDGEEDDPGKGGKSALDCSKMGTSGARKKRKRPSRMKRSGQWGEREENTRSWTKRGPANVMRRKHGELGPRNLERPDCLGKKNRAHPQVAIG